MKYIILILYVFTSFLHLLASYEDDSQKRKKTKPFLLGLLLLFYLFAAKEKNIFLILALLTSWLGDILLIPKGHNWFTYGGISFIFSHLFFVIVYMEQISFHHVKWLLVIPLAIVYFCIAFKVILAVRNTTPKKMILPMHFYLLCNSTMNVFAFMQLITTHSAGALVAYIGALLFFVSDCTLFIVRYYKNPEIIYRKHFTVMLTYLLGELLIVAGMLMIRG